MTPEQIEIGSAYAKGDKVRRVVSYGAGREWVVWGDERERLPLGGFVRTKCTSAKSFAKWAERKVEK
ncbi:hypothetical protein PHIM7_338 [Sinorhizobium phage phiM7]|uniref:Uncharacterized protein n=3 Tax=Emdodecavirus TaxID=1980937 RepID=S5MVY2_9CAUD|nr:hypothetical protein AB690_gp177 [Sinorhizobium phage phiM12]YP_009212583.1 hypothetical protein AVT40_gp190 [Sinorhizobium phage phiN3]YP_009601463.1 hypothetical protein FDH46_gp140 [Sinorhizobium phage phiM7]AKF13243.1 hypothetical protein PHIM19_338 [Sinorhizobium phage phiM19]AGR48067.1 hypothetical protein SmphiM12_435 [Sinorhizobium phage phiM12]AKF12883.1 hypothetical protein PHIM7_338 [Sinorhizobium phage phiM7]AKF13606.1 hypothetical protein PHIN3_343 [Sinorhizobium phage phiN3]